MANRQYKDSVFRTYFNCAERLAALYRAIRQDETILPEDIRITTLDDVFLSRLKNDVSFPSSANVIKLSRRWHPNRRNDC